MTLQSLFYNGLPVCAMCERVNRYVVYFRKMLKQETEGV